MCAMQISTEIFTGEGGCTQDNSLPEQLPPRTIRIQDKL